jgi:poly(hydroxyalkanoate) depolymerase family esterase
MYYYGPKNLSGKAPLVVLLHGCAQAASEFDDETGWTKLADENGFYLLLPQQREVNNNSRCFNWFEAADIRRDNGEAASIIEMVDYMEKLVAIDATKIYVAGLSAGGAMTSVMLANYPEVFSAGAIVAGIPFGCASSLMNAWNCMFGNAFPAPTAQQRGDAVRRAAGSYNGPWPRVMVIHGTTDELVNFKNAQFNVDQWTNVHGIDAQADATTTVQGQQYLEFKKGNDAVVSLLTVRNQRHGYPVDARNGCGETGKYVLDSGVCASKHILNFFKLNK